MDRANIPEETPVIIGVGQFSERIDQPAYRGFSPAELIASAARAACDDALANNAMPSRIDALYLVRSFADSVPVEMKPMLAPFGAPDCPPGAIARRLGASPRLLVYSPACGDEPQRLVSEACEHLHAGDIDCALVCGGEATSTIRAAQQSGHTYDWSEALDTPYEDRGANLDAILTSEMLAHQAVAPTALYALFENARRNKLNLSPEAYRDEMAALMAPFSVTAAGNPHAASPKIRSAESIAAITPGNRMVADPHPRSVVARDQVNQAAAVLITTIRNARAWGVSPDKWTFLHGHSALRERPVMERRDLGASPAMTAAYERALASADRTVADVSHIDVYSCFPIAVFAALDGLGISPRDKRGLTLTGGLSYFGGPGNNYSLHAICEVVGRLRQDRTGIGLVGANGGFMSTHAVGVYAAEPRPFRPSSCSALQDQLDGAPAPLHASEAVGPARIETYTVLYQEGAPLHAVVIGRLEENNARFIAAHGDRETLFAFASGDSFERKISVRRDRDRNIISLMR